MKILSRIVPFLMMIGLNVLTTPSAEAVFYFKPNAVPDTMPNAIRVRLDDPDLCNQRNQERGKLGLPDLVCDDEEYKLDPATYTMDEYVTGVLKAEASSEKDTPFWHIDALKALAVTIRSFAWTHGTVQADATFEIGSSTNAQGFFPERPTNENYAQAADQTSGQYLSHPDGEGAAQVITGNYSRQHGPKAGTFYTRDGDKTYLKSVYDPILGDRPGPKGHGWGLAQLGAYYWAIGQDHRGRIFPALNYLQILTHYYTGVHVRNSDGDRLTPEERWIPLETTIPAGVIPGEEYRMTVTVQNTGVADWTAPFPQLTCWQRHDPALPCASRLTGGQAAGDHLMVTLFVIVPELADGTYTLVFDLEKEDRFFHDRETGRPWFRLETAIQFCQAGCWRLYQPVILRHETEDSGGDCPLGELVMDETFGNRAGDDPFSQGTDRIAPRPWTRVHFYPGGVPFPARPEQIDITAITWKVYAGDRGRYGVRFVDEINDNETPGLTDDFDQVIYRRMTLPANVAEVEISFLLHMETTEETPPPNSSETLLPTDFFYFDLSPINPEQLLLKAQDKYTSDKFECNNGTRCNPANRIGGGVIHGDGEGQPQRLRPVIVYPGADFDNTTTPYIVFWVNVDNQDGTVFFLDEVNIKVKQCQ